MSSSASRQDSPMVDEMFDGAQMEIAEAELEDEAVVGGAQGGQGGQQGQQSAMAMQQGQQGANQAAVLLSELTYGEKTVHADFDRKFGELYDDKDLN